MIAFEVMVASIWVALIKGIIGLLLLLPMIQRFFKLFEYNLLKSRKIVKIVIAILMIIFMVGVYFHMNLIKGICFWTTYYDENDSKGIPLTTAMIRKFYPSSWPSGNKPCLVYATLPENGLNEVFINFHINLDSCKNQECHPSFEYRKYDEENVDNQTWKLGDTIKGEYESPSSEYSRRHIFTVLLKNLTPNTTYIFRVTESSWNNSDSHLYSYKTFDTENIVIINGGDVGNGDLPMKMNKNVVNKIKADMIMIGGDIVYDNNVPHCYQAMDHFLMRLNHNYRDDRTNTTRVIPILLAPGNHDLGVIPYIYLKNNKKLSY